MLWYFALQKYLSFSKKRFSCTEQNSIPKIILQIHCKYVEVQWEVVFLWLKIFTAQKYQKGKRKSQQSYNQQTFFIPAENNSVHIQGTVQLLENNFFDFFTTVSYFFTALIFLHFGWYLEKHQNTWLNFSSLIFRLFFSYVLYIFPVFLFPFSLSPSPSLFPHFFIFSLLLLFSL